MLLQGPSRLQGMRLAPVPVRLLFILSVIVTFCCFFIYLYFCLQGLPFPVAFGISNSGAS